jgi:hypothetical protein
VLERCRGHRSLSDCYWAPCGGGGHLGHQTHCCRCARETERKCENGSVGVGSGVADAETGAEWKRYTTQICCGMWRMAECHCTASSSSYIDRKRGSRAVASLASTCCREV